jgi:hypothetical protein
MLPRDPLVWATFKDLTGCRASHWLVNGRDQAGVEGDAGKQR